METNVNYTLVGAFVITLMIATILCIVWLSSGFKFKQNQRYLINMQESVGGLSLDAPVEFNGVNVGSVKEIEIDHKNPQRVKILISVQANTPISQGTVAMLNTRGVTGMTYLALKDVGNNLQPLKTMGTSYPIIRSVPSLFTRLDTALTKLSTSLLNITDTFGKVFDADNQQALKETLHNLDIFTRNLVGNNEQLTKLIQSTTSASQQIAPLLNASATSMRTIQNQTLPATYRILQNLETISRNLADVSLQLKENPSVLLRGSQPSALAPGEGK